MKFFSDLNTYFKLLIFIIGSSVLFFFVYITLYIYTSKQENNLYLNTQKQYYTEVSSVVELSSKTTISIISDVTYWDELNQFAITKDKDWYSEYIANDFDSYETDYIGVYGIDGQLISKTASTKITSNDFIPIQAMKLLHGAKLMHFYMQISEGLVEVFGATIHPSNDPKKTKSKPTGYFFMVNLIDEKYFKTLGDFSSSTVDLVKLNETDDGSKNVLNAQVLIKDYRNSDIAALSFKRSFNLHFSNTKQILLILMIANLISIALYFYFSKKWIYRPITLVTDVLETGNLSSISFLKAEPGEFGHIGHLFEDNIYQRKQLEISKEKAEESDRLKSSFLANLSHEIRTPMNAIVGFSDLLNEQNLSVQVQKEYLSIIKNCGTNLVSIIEDLIEMSKIDSKQIVPTIVSVNLNSCIKELYETIKVTVPKNKDIELQFLNDGYGITKNILTDIVKLKQVIVNLISNAIKYTENGKIIFGYQINEINNTIVFSVKDTGMGIDKENLKFIFDRFRRIEDDFSIELSGLGLGLAISKAYVEILGGTIAVSSELKVGSIFTVTIPLKYDDTEFNPRQIVEEKATEKSQGQTILIAEDDNINYLLLKRILELKNYKVLRAHNGQEAVEICRNNADLDLVFMDIKMPILNGFEALKMIKSFNPKIPIVAQTAYASAEDCDRIIKASFTSYVSKPLDKERVFDVVDSIFNERRSSS